MLEMFLASLHWAAPCVSKVSTVQSVVNSGHHRGRHVGGYYGIRNSLACKGLQLTPKLTRIFFMDTESIAKQIEMLASGLAVLKRMIEQGNPAFPDAAKATAKGLRRARRQERKMKTETLGSLMVLSAFLIGGLAVVVRMSPDMMRQQIGMYAGILSIGMAVVGCIVSISGKKA